MNLLAQPNPLEPAVRAGEVSGSDAGASLIVRWAGPVKTVISHCKSLSPAHSFKSLRDFTSAWARDRLYVVAEHGWSRLPFPFQFWRGLMLPLATDMRGWLGCPSFHPRTYFFDQLIHDLIKFFKAYFVQFSESLHYRLRLLLPRNQHSVKGFQQNGEGIQNSGQVVQKQKRLANV